MNPLSTVIHSFAVIVTVPRSSPGASSRRTCLGELADLALWAGVQPVLRLEKTPAQALVEARLLEGDKEDTAVVLNHSAERVSIRLRSLTPTCPTSPGARLLQQE